MYGECMIKCEYVVLSTETKMLLVGSVAHNEQEINYILWGSVIVVSIKDEE